MLVKRLQFQRALDRNRISQPSVLSHKLRNKLEVCLCELVECAGRAAAGFRDEQTNFRSLGKHNNHRHHESEGVSFLGRRSQEQMESTATNNYNQHVQAHRSRFAQHAQILLGIEIYIYIYTHALFSCPGVLHLPFVPSPGMLP